MFDTTLRHVKDRALASATRALRGVHPLAITGVGFVLGCAAAWCAAQGQFIAAFVLFWSGRVCDGLDGAVARLNGTQSALGGYLDLMADFVVYAAIPIGVWWAVKPAFGDIALIAMLATFYVNAASWMLLSAIVDDRERTTTVAMPTGLIEGFETLVAYSLMLFVPTAQVWIFSIFAVLVFATAMQRIVWACRHL
jgi:phosphatidylglycerophosphate synthase